MNIKETLEDLATAAYCGVSTVEELRIFEEAIEAVADNLPLEQIRLSMALRKCIIMIDETLATLCETNELYVDNGLLANKIRLIGNVFGSRFK